MPPKTLVNSCIIIFDCKCTDIEQALRALRHISLTKLLIQDKSEVKLILANAASSNNFRHFANIKCIADVCYFDARKIVQSVENELIEIQKSESNNCNWLECLYFATNLVQEELNVCKKVLSHQILFLTDLHNFQSIDENDEKSLALLDDLTTFFSVNSVFLYIIGLDMPSFNIPSYREFEQVVKKQPIENKALAKIVQNASHAVCANFQQGVHLFHSYVSLAEPQAWNVALTFGTGLEIACSTKRLINITDGTKITINKEVDANNFHSREVVYVCDEDGKQVAEEDLVSGLKIHEKFITVPRNEAFKGGNVEKRSFQALGFVSADSLPEYLLCAGDGSYIVESQGSATNTETEDNIFTTLVDVLRKEKKYLIARRVYNANNNPKYVILAPVRDKYHPNRPYFLLNQLPYADEVEFKCPEQERTKCTSIDANVEALVANFLDSIHLSNKNNQTGFIPTLLKYNEKITTATEVAADIYFKNDCKLDLLNKYYHIQELNPAWLKLTEIWPQSKINPKMKKEEDEDDFVF